MIRLALALILAAGPILADPSARLLHFTEDGTETGTPLLPGFTLHSVWGAIGRTGPDRVHVAVSNHDETEGNVALFRIGADDRVRFIGDLRTASEAAGNWHPGETQYKVHTTLDPHTDGLVYFATMPSSAPEGTRGAHLYRLDPATDEITDIGAAFPLTLARDLTPGPGTGVLFEGRGIKGLAMSPADPATAYAMTFDGGHLFRFDLDTGTAEEIGRSARVSYNFHVDRQGDVYYLGGADGAPQSLNRYDAATGETTALATGYDPDEEIGMIAPSANPDIVVILLAKSKQVFPLNTATERVLRGGTSCGTNWWRLFNMTASPNGEWLYFVSNNNAAAKVWRAPLGGGRCEEVLDIEALTGPRNLAFGGRSVWLGDSFYTPVWTHEGANDLAILKVTVD